MKPTPDKLIGLGRELLELAGVEDPSEDLCLSHGSIAWKLCSRIRAEIPFVQVKSE